MSLQLNIVFRINAFERHYFYNLIFTENFTLFPFFDMEDIAYEPQVFSLSICFFFNSVSLKV